MATLSRVDVDPVDMPHLQLEKEASHVGARPSRDFSAYTDATLDLGPPASSAWLGKTLFVATMVGIIAAASVTAVREQEPWLAPVLRTAENVVPAVSERISALLDTSQALPAANKGIAPEPSSTAATILAAQATHPASSAPAVQPAAVAKSDAPAQALRHDEPAKLAAKEEAALLPGLAEPNEHVRLPEVVFMNPEPEVQKQPALAARPNKARTARARARAKAALRAKVAAPAASQAAPVSGNWEQAREAARTAYAAGRYREALTAYEQAVRMNPRHGLTLAGLGAARMQTGDAPGAVDAYKRAVATQPTNLTFQIALARAYERTGDEARARETYQRVLKLDRNNVAAQVGLERL